MLVFFDGFNLVSVFKLTQCLFEIYKILEVLVYSLYQFESFSTQLNIFVLLQKRSKYIWAKRQTTMVILFQVAHIAMDHIPYLYLCPCSVSHLDLATVFSLQEMKV